jgi:hypothetical protein
MNVIFDGTHIDGTQVMKTYPDYKRFSEEFKKESDRAAVILGAAKIEDILHQMLEKCFQEPSDEFISRNLSGLSIKIKLCYHLGLFDEELLRILKLIRDIRNDFAHLPDGCKLDDGINKKRVNDLVKPYVNEYSFKQYREEIYGGKDNSSVNFRIILAFAVMHLNGTNLCLKKTKSGQCRPLGIKQTIKLMNKQIPIINEMIKKKKEIELKKGKA